MKIGIMTFFRPINYGAYLQAYALSHRLNQENGIEAEIINFYMPAENETYEKQLKIKKNLPRTLYERRRYKTFRQALSNQTLSNYECCGDIKEFISLVNYKYDVIIAGSDEIWRVDGMRGFPTPYFLPGDLHCIKVSYAASGRTSFDYLSKSNRNLLKQYLDDFEYIGVRDIKTKDEIKKLVPNKEVVVNYDPTFVYNFKPDIENGKYLLKKYFNVKGTKKVIALMYNGRAGEKMKIESYLKNRYGKDCIFISLYDWSYGLHCSPDITPMEWIDIIAAIDGMISTYFHGICFSIIEGTPFFALDKNPPSTEESKLFDLLCRLDKLDMYSYGVENTINNNKMDDFITQVKNGEHFDPTNILNQARSEFDNFIIKIQSIYNESLLK